MSRRAEACIKANCASIDVCGVNVGRRKNGLMTAFEQPLFVTEAEIGRALVLMNFFVDPLTASCRSRGERANAIPTDALACAAKRTAL